ncbi:MAG TPA: sugar ABC transporter permease, partial [Spirochaetia bacterium]|nr:sugar ABC transporter permease [Spirochaetia bacterium]
MRRERGTLREGLQSAAGTRLFLMALPFLAVVFLFSYLPLYGWVYAFFDYRAGLRLRDVRFTGLKYFAALTSNPISSREILRVLRNTFALSLLSILTSPLPVVFAIFLLEIRAQWYRRIVQTLTTLPNFISWILVYSVA